MNEPDVASNDDNEPTAFNHRIPKGLIRSFNKTAPKREGAITLAKLVKLYVEQPSILEADAVPSSTIKVERTPFESIGLVDVVENYTLRDFSHEINEADKLSIYVKDFAGFISRRSHQEAIRFRKMMHIKQLTNIILSRPEPSVFAPAFDTYAVDAFCDGEKVPVFSWSDLMEGRHGTHVSYKVTLFRRELDLPRLCIAADDTIIVSLDSDRDPENVLSCPSALVFKVGHASSGYSFQHHLSDKLSNIRAEPGAEAISSLEWINGFPKGYEP